jgi:hypothetical protein
MTEAAWVSSADLAGSLRPQKRERKLCIPGLVLEMVIVDRLRATQIINAYKRDGSSSKLRIVRRSTRARPTAIMGDATP